MAYDRYRAEGWDIDAPSVDMARNNAVATGLDDRVIFSSADASRLGGASYDAIFAFECLHDMPRPVEVLAELRRAIRPGGVVVVMDEAVSDAFEGPANELDRLMYGFSLFVCLPDGMSSQPSAGTGTVMRIDKLRAYATEAGFRGVEVLPTGEFGSWRFYRLHA